MGYYTTSKILDLTKTLGSSYIYAKTMVDWIRDVLAGADPQEPCDPNTDTTTYPGLGWAATPITAEITFTALAITAHNLFNLGGNKFEFVDHDAPVFGGIPVPLGASNNESLDNLGVAVSSALQWEWNRPNSGAIRFYKTIDPVLCNNIVCTITPSGSVGIWSSSTGVAGEGFTYNGGYLLTSDRFNILDMNPISIKVITYGNGPYIIIQDAAGTRAFNGLQTNNAWRILASKYQFVLFVPGKTSNGTFLIASHMKPLSDTTYLNFISGPINPIVGTDGGHRNSLSTFNVWNSVNTDGVAYSINAGSVTANQRTTLCFPGAGYGLIPVDKLSNNFLNLDVLRDDGTQPPYEAFLAVCDKHPSDGGTLSIRGAFWDSLIYPTYAAPDTLADLDGKEGISIVAQGGGSGASRGTFVTRIK